LLYKVAMKPLIQHPDTALGILNDIACYVDDARTAIAKDDLYDLHLALWSAIERARETILLTGPVGVIR